MAVIEAVIASRLRQSLHFEHATHHRAKESQWTQVTHTAAVPTMRMPVEERVCPITQAKIELCIELRGACFELSAILALLHSRGVNATHPYERTSFTRAELLHIHCSALFYTPEFLLEQGWMLPSCFLASVEPSGAAPAAEAPVAEANPTGGGLAMHWPRVHCHGMTYYEAATLVAALSTTLSAVLIGLLLARA